MDPGFLARKRRYEQQIFNAINDHPERFGNAPLSSDADDWRRWRMKAGSPDAHHPQPHHAATGAEVQWHAPFPHFRYKDDYHSFLRLTPEIQAAYKDDPRFQNFDEFGRRYATLGAGPMPEGGLLNDSALLASFANQKRDVVPHPAGIPIEPRSGMRADDYIDLLFKLDSEYPDDLPYEIWQSKRHFVVPGGRGPSYAKPAYNSNGYVSGLLAASGVTPPGLSVAAPGYARRVPARAFGQ